MTRAKDIPGRSSDELLSALTKHGVTVESLVETLNDIRLKATSFSKAGDEIPDRANRLKATQVLLQLMGLASRAPIEPANKDLTPEAITQLLAK